MLLLLECLELVGKRSQFTLLLERELDGYLRALAPVFVTAPRTRGRRAIPGRRGRRGLRRCRPLREPVAVAADVFLPLALVSGDRLRDERLRDDVVEKRAIVAYD